MTDLTIGQRIAQRRKMLNLSQEALGEKMGVSRQAISKWEADGTVPEIDKLIAMSKLFGVSVGWLLGTESDTAVAEDKNSFSEEQLILVEEIVKRYQQPPEKKREWIPTAVACVLLAVVAVFLTVVLFWDYVNRFAAAVSQRFYEVSGNYLAIQDQLEGVTDRLDELAKGEKLLETYTLEGSAWEDMTGATVRFSGIPKYTVAGESVWLSVRLNDEEVARSLCVSDGTVYTAEVDLPAADGYSYYFQVTYEEGGGAQQILTEAPESCADLTQGLQGHIIADILSWGYSHADMELHIDAMTVVRHGPELLGEGQTLQWQQVDLVIYHNGAEWDRVSLLERFGSMPDPSYSRMEEVEGADPDTCYVVWNSVLPELEEGDIVQIQLEYRHTGIDTVQQLEKERLWENNGFTEVYRRP